MAFENLQVYLCFFCISFGLDDIKSINVDSEINSARLVTIVFNANSKGRYGAESQNRLQNYNILNGTKKYLITSLEAMSEFGM